MITAYDKREKIISIPTDDYTKVMLLGTTGAGKTTLLRQLIGTDPDKEKFPSTSPSRTTIHDIEIITGEFDNYSAVVTFITEKETRLLVEECVKDAVISYIASKNEDEMMQRFLTHKDNRFRLSYIIGKIHLARNEMEDELFDEDDFEESSIPFAQSEEIQEKLKKYKNKLIEISNSTHKKVGEFLNVDIQQAANEEKETVIELIEDILQGGTDEFNNEYNDFIKELLHDIRQKIELINNGEIYKNEEWFDYWTYETSNRIDFIKTINQFSSNYASDYGKLLTPLVSGVRVKGAFKAKNDTEYRKLVLIDGEGLGHTRETSTSLSGNITNKFKNVDAIILVDTAQQPMLAAPAAALKNIVNYAVEDKLILAFTHFDQVKGDNLRTIKDKKNFTLNSIENILDEIGKDISKEAKRELKQVIDKNTVFLWNIQQKELHKFTKSELRTLTGLILEKTDSIDFENQSVAFDSSFLEKHILKAISEFHKKWDGYLGLYFHPIYNKQHWATIKAFTKRLGIFQWEEYNHLKPISDLAEILNQNMRLFIDSSIIEPLKPIEKDLITWTKRKILSETSQEIRSFIASEISYKRTDDWETAYEHSGVGSSKYRAMDIKNIYNDASLNPREDMPLMQLNSFVEKIKEIIKISIEQNDCKLI